jgi:hypothetical protein
MNTRIVQELDSFIIESGRRKVVLARVANGIKPFANIVYVRASAPFEEEVSGIKWAQISIAEYYTEESARHDFEVRRPKMRDAEGEDMPMQKGKRLIQEVMQEKLGG